jgi:hypothetical protein
MTRRGHKEPRFSINEWARVMGNHLIRPCIFPVLVARSPYLRFLRRHLPHLLDSVPLRTQGTWLLHDAAAARSSLAERERWGRHYPWRRIDRGPEATVPWPARSPDLNSIHFYLWGSMTNAIYGNFVDSREQLWQRIQMQQTRLVPHLGSSNASEPRGGRFNHLL